MGADPLAYFRLTDGMDPEERLEEAALWKAMHDAFDGKIAAFRGDPAHPAAAKVYGRGRRSEFASPLRYWEDPAFLRETRRGFVVCPIEEIGHAIGGFHSAGLGAFVKSTKDKHAIFRIPVGADPDSVIGDFAYSFIDGGPALMVQALSEITFEWRFLCIGRKIVTQSPNAAHLTPLDCLTAGAFRTPQDRLPSTPPADTFAQLLAVARRVAGAMLTEDAVIDCALINGEPGCVELNPMIVGGVGLFACDVRALAAAVRDRDFPHLALPAENSAGVRAISEQGSLPPDDLVSLPPPDGEVEHPPVT